MDDCDPPYLSAVFARLGPQARNRIRRRCLRRNRRALASLSGAMAALGLAVEARVVQDARRRIDTRRAVRDDGGSPNDGAVQHERGTPRVIEAVERVIMHAPALPRPLQSQLELARALRRSALSGGCGEVGGCRDARRPWR